MTTVFIILALISLLGVIKIIDKIIGDRKCISHNTIRKYLTNRLSVKERNRTITHLGICKECQDKLHDYNFGIEAKDHLIDKNKTTR